MPKHKIKSSDLKSPMIAADTPFYIDIQKNQETYMISFLYDNPENYKIKYWKNGMFIEFGQLTGRIYRAVFDEPSFAQIGQIPKIQNERFQNNFTNCLYIMQNKINLDGKSRIVS